MGLRIGYKEIMAIGLLIILILVSIIAISMNGVDELLDPYLSMEITGTRITDGEVNNITPVEGKIWQVVNVSILNLNEKEDFLVSVPHFYANTNEGGSIWVFNGEDFQYDPIGPGENVTVQLVFLIPEGTHLLELEYVQKLSSPVKCSIPPVE